MCKSAPQNIPHDSPWLIFPRTETPIISHEPNSTRMACCSPRGQFSGHISLTAAVETKQGWLRETRGGPGQRESRMCGWGASYSVNRFLKHTCVKQNNNIVHAGFHCHLGRAFVHPPQKKHLLSCWNKRMACVQWNPPGYLKYIIV